MYLIRNCTTSFFIRFLLCREQFYLKKNYEQMPLISNFKWFFTVFFVLLGILVVFSRKIYFTEERFLFKMFQILSARKLHGKSFIANFIFCAVIETSKYWIKYSMEQNLHKKWSSPWKASSVNATKSAENCGFGHIPKY